MGLQITFVTHRDGEEALSATTTTAFVSGSPLMVAAAGDGLCLATGVAATYVGVACKTRVALAANGAGQASYLAPGSICKLLDDSANDANDTEPFDAALTYADGDDLYIDNNGLWSNNAPGVGDVPAQAVARALVVKVSGGAGSAQILKIQLLNVG
jgi:hypothetical protein